MPPINHAARQLTCSVGIKAFALELKLLFGQKNRRFWNGRIRSLASGGGAIVCAMVVALDVVAATEPETQSPAKNDAEVLSNLSMDELLNVRVTSVYSASKHEQEITQAPAAVSIITADDFKKFGYRNLAEALRSVRGFYAANDRNYSYLGIRGFNRPGDYNTRVLLMVDGHRMNDNIYDSAQIGAEDFLDIDLVDRVEVIRGPSSSIYGNNAFLGVINVITKRGRHFGGLETSGSYGTFDTYTGRLTYGNSFESGVDLLLSGTLYGSAGDRRLDYPEFDDAENNFGVAEDSDEDYSRKFFGSLGWRDLRLSGGYSWREKNIPTASFGTIFNDRHELVTDVRAFADLKYDREFSGDLEVMGRAFYDRYEYYGDYPFDATDVGGPPRLINKDVSQGDWVGIEAQVAKTLADRYRLTAGADFRENLGQFQYNFDDTRPRTDYVRSDHNSRNYGLYFQGEASVLTNLLVNAGVRYDHYDTFGGTVNPRAAVIYSPWAPTTFKLLYGEAFRAPSDFELYYYAPGFGSSLSLQPEEIRTYELVWEQDLAPRYRFSASLYRYEVENLIAQQTDPLDGSIFFDNEDARGHGLELEMEGRYTDEFRVRLSYAVQRAEDTDDADAGTELTSSPRHLAKLNASWPLYDDKVFAGFELQYHGSVRTLAGSRADDFLIANLTLYSRELVRNVEFSAGLYNLFDTRYSYPGAGDHLQNVIEQDGRSFRVKLTWRF